jgi:hypothetical protein
MAVAAMAVAAKSTAFTDNAAKIDERISNVFRINVYTETKRQIYQIQIQVCVYGLYQ